MQRLSAQLSAGARTVGLVLPAGPVHGPEPRLLARLLAEHARMALGARVVLLDQWIDREWAETAVLSGRADYVGLPGHL